MMSLFIYIVVTNYFSSSFLYMDTRCNQYAKIGVAIAPPIISTKVNVPVKATLPKLSISPKPKAINNDFLNMSKLNKGLEKFNCTSPALVDMAPSFLMIMVVPKLSSRSPKLIKPHSPMVGMAGGGAQAPTAIVAGSLGMGLYAVFNIVASPGLLIRISIKPK